MSLFHSLQNVYYDASHLQEAMEEIPSKCDCGDAEAHLSGRRRCVSASTVTVTINALLLNRVRFATDRRPVASSISHRGYE